MGSTHEDIEAALKDIGPNSMDWQEYAKSESPQHKVILTQPIYFGVTEVTQLQYEKVMGINPSHFSASGPGKGAVDGIETGSHPVETVSWDDAAEFCAKLSQKEVLKPCYFVANGIVTPLNGTGYRLPSEAEWEFACRAGTTTKYWIGDRTDQLMMAGWFNWNSDGRTHTVGELKSNPFNLSDVHGNVWEWVADSWDSTFYTRLSGKTVDPEAPSFAGSKRVARGGSRGVAGSVCLSSSRGVGPPSYRAHDRGFRVVLVVDRSRVKQP